MIERADLCRDHAVHVHEPWWSLRHSGMVKMQLTRLGHVELYRPDSAGKRACWVLCPMLLLRLTRESCIEKVQPAREEECWNSYMLSTMTRSCTLYILAQLPSDMCFQYTVLIKCSICSYPHWLRTLREWLKKKIHVVWWRTVLIFHQFFFIILIFLIFSFFILFFLFHIWCFCSLFFIYSSFFEVSGSRHQSFWVCKVNFATLKVALKIWTITSCRTCAQNMGNQQVGRFSREWGYFLSVFMNDCTRAVFLFDWRRWKIKKILINHQILKKRRSLKLCKSDFKTSQTLPQNSTKLHFGKTVKQIPGIIYLFWSRQYEIYREHTNMSLETLYCVCETWQRHCKPGMGDKTLWSITPDDIHGQVWYHGQTSAIPWTHIFRSPNDPNHEINSDILRIHGTAWFQRKNHIHVDVQQHLNFGSKTINVCSWTRKGVVSHVLEQKNKRSMGWHRQENDL